jgi:hypothetical protein
MVVGTWNLVGTRNLGENEMVVGVGGQWALGKMAFYNLVVTCQLHYDFSYKVLGFGFQSPRYKYVSCHLCVNSLCWPLYMV